MIQTKASWKSFLLFFSAVTIGIGWGMLAVYLEAVARVFFELSFIFFLAIGFLKWSKWRILTDQSWDRELMGTGKHVFLWAERFKTWFAANNMLWGVIIVLLGGIMLTMFGAQPWVLAIITGIVACMVPAFTGHFLIRKQPMLALCWRDTPSWGIKNPVEYVRATFSIKARLERALNQGCDLAQKLVEALQNDKVQQTGYYIQPVHRDEVSLKEEIKQRCFASITLAVVTAAIFFLLALLNWVPERRYLSFGDGPFVLPGIIARALGADSRSGRRALSAHRDVGGNPSVNQSEGAEGEEGSSQDGESSGGEGQGSGGKGGANGGSGSAESSSQEGTNPSREAGGESSESGGSCPEGPQNSLEHASGDQGNDGNPGKRENSGPGDQKLNPSGEDAKKSPARDQDGSQEKPQDRSGQKEEKTGYSPDRPSEGGEPLEQRSQPKGQEGEKGPDGSPEPNQDDYKPKDGYRGNQGQVIELSFPALRPAVAGSAPAGQPTKIRPKSGTSTKPLELPAQGKTAQPKQHLPPWIAGMLKKDSKD